MTSQLIQNTRDRFSNTCEESLLFDAGEDGQKLMEELKHDPLQTTQVFPRKQSSLMFAACPVWL